MKDFNRLVLFGHEYSEKELLAKANNVLAKDSWEIQIWAFIKQWLNEKDYIVVATSGSTGNPKQIKILKEKMIASAGSTCKHLGVNAMHKALLCMSAEHIGGMMMIVRAFYQGYDLHYVEPKANPLLDFNTPIDFIALVPYQAKTILETNPEKLQTINNILIGGGTADKSLEQSLLKYKVSAYSAFGMTETISHIALKKIGKEDFYTCLPSVKIAISKNDTLVIHAPKLILEPLETNDLIEYIDEQKFRWIGRLDFAIESGGLKVIPEILEKKMAAKLTCNYIISSLPHPKLGQEIVLIMEGDSFRQISSALFEDFNKYEKPKQIIFLENLSYTKSGKIDRLETRKQILSN